MSKDQNPPHIDAFSVGLPGYVTSVLLRDRARFLTNYLWLRLGACSIFSSGRDGTQRFAALYRRTNEDDAWILQFDVAGLEVQGVSEGIVRMQARIPDDMLSVFNVPSKLPKERTGHLPKHNAPLFDMLRGRRIEIVARKSDASDE